LGRSPYPNVEVESIILSLRAVELIKAAKTKPTPQLPQRDASPIVVNPTPIILAEALYNIICIK
jgi:hypothetical protein